MASRPGPLCTTGVEFEWSWSFLPNFVGTVKIVAKLLVGMVSLCILSVVHDWYCLIGSLVILHSHDTHMLIANTLYMAFIYMYVSHACSYVVFIYSYISHMCSCIAHVLCLLHMSFICPAQPGHT